MHCKGSFTIYYSYLNVELCYVLDGKKLFYSVFINGKMD